MFRIGLLLWLCLSAFAADDNTIELFATSLQTEGNVTKAEGDVLIFYEDYYLSANRARFDRENGELELFGNVTAMKGSSFHAMGEHIRLNVQRKTQCYEPFFLLDKQSQVWMSTRTADANMSRIELEGGIVSGCDPADPLWQMRFSSADYDNETKWLNLYNARLYLYDTPLFYFPYFGYSLDTSRRTGFLTPSLGLSNTEGFYYQQPFYIALHNAWDLELRPQMRTQRGSGLYGTLRFVDSNDSWGSVTGGFFQEKPSYAKEYQLAHPEHYGVNAHYENYRWLQHWFGADLSGQSGMYADVTWMNDVDFLNLENNNEIESVTSNQLFSRINLFYNTQSDYFGTYVKYFLDLSKQDNSATIQNLPIVHYHRYLQSFFDRHLYYSLNVNLQNYYRTEGKEAFTGRLDLPVAVQTSLFDDYLDLEYKAQLHGRYITFSGEGAPLYDHHYETSLYGRNYHSVEAGTHLTKAFETVTHTFGLSATYVRDGSDYRSGYYKELENTCSAFPGDAKPCEFYDFDWIDETTAINLTQYLFDADGTQLLYHRLLQSVSYGQAHERLSALENELEYYFGGGWSLYNNTLFDHQKGVVTKMLNAMRYNGEAITVDIDHLYEDTEDGVQAMRTSYMTSGFEYRYNRHYRYRAGYAYDFENALKKSAEIGFLYTKRCWDFGLRYVENRRPILTDADASSVYDKYVYFTVMFKPVGGSDFSYKISDLLEGTQ